MNEKLELATNEDYDEIMQIYHSSIGKNGCTWNLEYPNDETFKTDIEKQNLLCIKNEKKEVIAVISIDEDEEVDKLPVWNKNYKKSAEIARVAVREDYRRQKIATKMMGLMLQELLERGYDAVHLLVSKTNPAAIRCYNKFDFEVVGESDLFGEDWLCYEKPL